MPRWFTDYHTMLAEPDIEMVTITAPNRLHCEMTIDIANAGKHVVCEKPLCMTHRLSTIRNANCILVLDQGRIVERGRYEELVAMGGCSHGQSSCSAPMM